MKNFRNIALIGVAAATMVACGRVPHGHEGVKVNLYGNDRGVQAEELGVGWVWVGPGHELYQFPTFTQNVVWTQSKTEGSKNDDSFTFQDRDGLELSADIGISYFVEPGKSAELFQKYRRGIDEITSVFLRNMVRDALVEYTADMSAEEVYSTRKVELINRVEESVRQQVVEFGLNIEKIYLVGSIRLPTAVIDSINAKIQATQIAQQRENEVATATAEANKQIEAARGRAESVRIEAEQRAAAIEVEGEALRRNPEILKLRQIEQWNGIYPTTLVTGGDTPPALILNQ